MPNSIYKGDYFNNLKLNPSPKTELGFIHRMLNALLERCDDARRNMNKPRGFHLILTLVNQDKVSEIPRVIKRWVENRKLCKLSTMTGKYHFIKAEEERPLKKEFHIHLYIIADGIQYTDIQSLRERLLVVAGEIKLKNRGRKFRPELVDSDTGECLLDTFSGNFKRKGLAWCHNLHDEYDDFFERASYVCKVKTKVSLHSWSCNQMERISTSDSTAQYDETGFNKRPELLPSIDSQLITIENCNSLAITEELLTIQ